MAYQPTNSIFLSHQTSQQYFQLWLISQTSPNEQDNGGSIWYRGAAGDAADQRGYKCYNLLTTPVLISRHVYFDETCFPFVQDNTSTTPAAPPCPLCMPDVLLIPFGSRRP